MKKTKSFTSFPAALMALLLLLSLISGPAIAAQQQARVRVGCFPLNGFCAISEDGAMSGYGVEYTGAVAEVAGWDYEYVPYESWVQALSAMERGEIDILAPAQRTAERSESFSFDAFPIGTEYGSLLCLSTSSLVYEDFTAFNGLKVGCVPSLIFLDDFLDYEERNGFSADISYYKDTPALLAALNAGEVEAIVANLMVKTGSMKALARFGASPFYYMLNSEADGVLEELNSAIDKLNSQRPGFQRELEEKYFSSISQTPLSREELSFAEEGTIVKVACPSNYAPFSYIDAETGEISGVYAALLAQIAESSGLSFELIPIPEGEDGCDFAKENGIPVLAGKEMDTKSLGAEGLRLTDSVFMASKSFFGLADTEFDTASPMKIAVTSDCEELICSWQESYPAFTFVQYPSAKACIGAVISGEVDAMLHSRDALEPLLSDPHNSKLHALPSGGVSVEVCFAVLPEADLRLLSVLDKSVALISDEDVEMYLSGFAQKNQYHYSLFDFIYQYRLMLTVLLAALIISAFVLLATGRERRKSHKAIAENEMKLRSITNNINGGVVVLKADMGLEIVYANDGFLSMIGLTRQQFDKAESGSYTAYVHPDDLPKIRTAIDNDESELSLELRVLRQDKSYVNALFTCSAGVKTSGERELYCVIMDISEQLRLLEQQRISIKRTELILSKVQEIFYEVNLKDRTISVSPSFREKLGWELPKVLGWELGQNVENMWRAGAEDLEKLKTSTITMLLEGQPASCTVQLEARDRQAYIWCEVMQYPILSEGGEVVSVIGLIKDVNDIVQEREKLLEQASRDPLTGLYNKETFKVQVCAALEEMPNKNHALIFMDLDNFKSVNDTLGHVVGDRAICDAAEKLQIIFSNYDLISRFGGDEFCVFVKDVPTATLKRKLDWLVEKLRAEYSDGAGVASVTCSCGVACTERVGYSFDKLLQSADTALYKAKEDGRDRYAFAL